MVDPDSGLDSTGYLVLMCCPSRREVANMLRDLRCVFGGFNKLARVSGMNRMSFPALCDMRRARVTSPAVARLVWLWWVFTLHPGAVTSWWHVGTCCRFSEVGSPASAGKLKPKRSQTKLRKSLRMFKTENLPARVVDYSAIRVREFIKARDYCDRVAFRAAAVQSCPVDYEI